MSTSTSTGDCAPAVLLSSNGSPPKEVSTSSSARSSSSYSTTTSSSSSNASRKKLALARLEKAKAQLAIAEAEEELARIDEMERDGDRDIECDEVYDISDFAWREIPEMQAQEVEPEEKPSTLNAEVSKAVQPIPLSWFGLDETETHEKAVKDPAIAPLKAATAPPKAAEDAGSLFFAPLGAASVPPLVTFNNDDSTNGSLPSFAPSQAAFSSNNFSSSSNTVNLIQVNLLDLTPPPLRCPMDIPQAFQQQGGQGIFAFQQQGGQSPFAIPQQQGWRQNQGASAWHLPPPVQALADESKVRTSALLPSLTPVEAPPGFDPYAPSSSSAQKETSSPLSSLWEAVTSTFRPAKCEEFELCRGCGATCKDVRDKECLKKYNRCAMCFLVENQDEKPRTSAETATSAIEDDGGTKDQKGKSTPTAATSATKGADHSNDDFNNAHHNGTDNVEAPTATFTATVPSSLTATKSFGASSSSSSAAAPPATNEENGKSAPPPPKPPDPEPEGKDDKKEEEEKQRWEGSPRRPW